MKLREAVGVVCLAVACAAATYPCLGATPTVVATGTDITTFTGGLGGKLVWVDATDTMCWQLSLANPSGTIAQVANTASAKSPQVSPDGDEIVFWSGAGVTMTVVLSSGTATTVKASGAYEPHWYPDGNSIVYVTTDSNDSSQGQTLQCPAGGGASTVLWASRAMDAGLSRDAKWLGEAYLYNFAVDLTASIEFDWGWYVTAAEEPAQTCNGSMSPDSGGDYRMMTLLIPHDYFGIFAYDSVRDRWHLDRKFFRPTVTGYQEWQHPEWSNHPDFAVATAGPYFGPYAVYLANTRDGTSVAGGVLQVISSDSDHPYLWLQASAPYLCMSPVDLTVSVLEGDTGNHVYSFTAYNWGTGASLGTVTDHTTKPAWMPTVSVTGSANTYSVDVTLNATGLTAMSSPYTDEVALSAASTTNAPDLAHARKFPITLHVLSSSDDEDADGVTNEQEILDGTDPLDATDPLPSVAINSFTASPTEIAPGGSVTLTWTTSHATSVSIDNSIGSVAESDSTSVSPTTTTTYVLTAQGVDGPVAAQVIVTVTPGFGDVVIDSFTTTSQTIYAGGCITLSWSTSNATDVSISPGIGTVAASGSFLATPGVSTTYTLTANGTGGPQTSSIIVTVVPAIQSATGCALVDAGGATRRNALAFFVAAGVGVEALLRRRQQSRMRP